MVSDKLSNIARNQEKDLQSIKRNKRNIDKNYQDIGDLLDRVQRLESIVKKYESSAPKPCPQTKRRREISAGNGNTKKTGGPMKIDLVERSAQLQVDRSALIKFNKTNKELPADERHTWQRIFTGKDGTIKTEMFDSIVDNKSLDCLLADPDSKAIVDNILVSDGGPALNIGTTIKKKYWVFLRDGKLTTISTDFKDGVGAEYLWTDDASLKPPSTKWKLPIKHTKDPRRRYIDPETNALWVPDDERKQEKPCASSDSSSDSSSGDESSDDDEGDNAREHSKGGGGVRHGDNDDNDDGDAKGGGGVEDGDNDDDDNNDNDNGDDDDNDDDDSDSDSKGGGGIEEGDKDSDNGDNDSKGGGCVEEGDKDLDNGDGDSKGGGCVEEGDKDDNGDSADGDSKGGGCVEEGDKDDNDNADGDSKGGGCVGEGDKDDDNDEGDGDNDNMKTSVEKDGSGNVSDLGEIGGSDDMEVSEEVGASVEESVGTKRKVDEFGPTSSDSAPSSGSDTESDSDDEKENVPPKMPRVM
jgi:hypothetical protein